MGMGEMMKTLMGDEKPLPKLYLDTDQLSKLGDVGPIGSEREIHCTVKVATLSKTDDGMTATLEDYRDGVYGRRRRSRSKRGYRSYVSDDEGLTVCLYLA